VALTAAAVEDRAKALAAGMNDHLTKPISRPELFACLKRILGEPYIESVFKKGDGRVANVQSDTQEYVGKVDSIARKGRVLIVDDQSTNIKVLANGLKDDYVIQAADSGKKALRLAETLPQPDIILLDVVMPEMDGFEVIKALKNNPQTQNIPVMFVTALDGSIDEQRGLELGAVDYITKPFKLPIIKVRVGSQINLKIKTDLLELESHLDGLTGIANRRQFDETLKKESQRLVRNGQPLGLIMLDIDNFKPFNDHYGHGKGDECLIKVAQAIGSVFQRSADLFARYGGEEFVVLMPETDAEGVRTMAEKIRQAVWALNFNHAYSSVAERVTISVGGISATVDSEAAAKTLLKQADKALYKAKENGRNKVVMF
jgi:diguanylate cyclase (GGDEF)-like protein